jgi:hypothetical protein
MKNIFKKLVIFVLVLIIIPINNNHLIYAIDAGNQLLYNGISNEIPFETLSLPPDYKNKPYITVKINGKSTKLKFNTELWVDKNIGVYGDYRYAPKNTFTNYTENPNPSITTPYYNKNGVKGEYRFHGYSVDGILYTNNCFPVEEASNRKAEVKSWQYHYWTNPILINKNDDKLSDYNKAALKGDKVTIVSPDYKGEKN